MAEQVVLDPGEISPSGYFSKIVSDSPSLYWRLGELSGTSAADSSGNGRAGTYSGGFTLGVAGALAGDSDKAVDLDGATGVVTSSYNPFTNATTRTFEGWAWRDTQTTFDTLFGGRQVANTNTYVRLASGSGDVQFTPDAAAANPSVTWTGAWPGTAQWVHWVLIFNESTDTAELYINGASQGTKVVTQVYNATPGVFAVGDYQSGANVPFDGKFDEAAVYERGLSAAQVLDHYQAGIVLGRQELDISSGAIAIRQEGVDWGDAEIQAYMAEQARGETPVDFRVPNRQIQIPLTLQTSGTVTFNQARTKLQKKIALIQREGGWIKRVLSDASGTVFADVVNATLHLPGGWLQANRSAENEATLQLECIPDFYGPQITLSDHVETSAAELVFTEVAPKGDYPARTRLVVDNDQANDQLGLIWSFRSLNYDSAATAASRYEAEALGIVSPAFGTALTGASGGTVVTNGTISTNWTPILNTNMGGTAYLTHRGSYRVFGRVYSTSGTLVQTRFVWDVGDLVLPAENDPLRLAGASNFYIVDYGEVRLDPAPTGTHRWQGQIQAKGDVGNESFSVDRLWIVNTDEGMGKIAVSNILPGGLVAYSARDEFNQTAGVVTGKALPVGGTWAGAGDADDASVTGTHQLDRTAVSDVDGNTGRYLTASTPTLTSTVVQADVKYSAYNIGQMNLLARYIDTNNWAYFGLGAPTASGSLATMVVVKRVAGTGSFIVLQSAPLALAQAAAWYTLRLYIDASGRFAMWAGRQGGALGYITSGQDAVFATGGALASGKVGIYDFNTSANAGTRSYDNFAAWVPTPDAAIYASRSAELRTEGIFRQDTGGTAYAPVSRYIGDLPRLPPGGNEGRTTEVFLKPSRGDFDTIPDSATGDDISAKIIYRPTWLYVPEP